MPIYANVTFTHIDDPYMERVAFDVLPRADDDIALVSAPLSAGPYQRIDRVLRVRHFVRDGAQTIELIVGDGFRPVNRCRYQGD